MTEISAERAERLRALALFHACSDEELAGIDALVDEIEVAPGEYLMREGAPGEEAFIVTTGEAEVSVAGQVVGRLEPGAFFGEGSLLDLTRTGATVRALTAMRLLVIDASEVATVLEHPGLAVGRLTGVVHRLRGEDPARSRAPTTDLEEP